MADEKGFWQKCRDGIDVAKGLFTLVADIPGIAAFIKVFFGEKAQTRLEERLLVDKRTELLEDIAKLEDPTHRETLRRRKNEAAARGEEDGFVWDICKIQREWRQLFMLEFLATRPDPEFWEWMDLLRDNKFEQFAIRLRRQAAKIMPILTQVKTWAQAQDAKVAPWVPVVNAAGDAFRNWLASKGIRR